MLAIVNTAHNAALGEWEQSYGVDCEYSFVKYSWYRFCAIVRSAWRAGKRPAQRALRAFRPDASRPGGTFRPVAVGPMVARMAARPQHGSQLRASSEMTSGGDSCRPTDTSAGALLDADTALVAERRESSGAAGPPTAAISGFQLAPPGLKSVKDKQGPQALQDRDSAQGIPRVVAWAEDLASEARRAALSSSAGSGGGGGTVTVGSGMLSGTGGSPGAGPSRSSGSGSGSASGSASGSGGRPPSTARESDSEQSAGASTPSPSPSPGPGARAEAGPAAQAAPGPGPVTEGFVVEPSTPGGEAALKPVQASAPTQARGDTTTDVDPATRPSPSQK